VKPGSRGDITPPKDAEIDRPCSPGRCKNAHPVWRRLVVCGDDLYVVLGKRHPDLLSRRESVVAAPRQTADISHRRQSGGKLYFANQDGDGDVYVLKAGPVYQLLAQNHLGEVQMATSAISGDTIL
jgi:hypothetical protein